MRNDEDPLEDVYDAPLTDSWTQKWKRWGSVLRGREPRPTSLEMFHAHGKSSGLSTRFRWIKGGELGIPFSIRERSIVENSERRVLSKSEVIENFWESGKDWDLDHTSGPHDCTSLTAWYFRRRDVIERRKLEIEDGPLLLGCFRWLSLDWNASSLMILRRIPRLFTMHLCADRIGAHEGRINRRARKKLVESLRSINDWSWIGDIIAIYA